MGKENLPVSISEEKLIEYLDLFQSTNGITDIEKKQFINIAKMSNLNPFKREIYITAYGRGESRQCSIITGYEVYIKRAEESGRLDGWNVSIESCSSIKIDSNSGIVKCSDIKAVIVIHRKDFSNPFTHEVVFSEYAQRKKDGTFNKFWKEKPRTMLKKVAISQGFRLCFNEVLGGLPYTSEEFLDESNYEIVEKNKKEVDLNAMLEEGKASLIDVENLAMLEDLWLYYPELHSNRKWKKIIADQKIALENKSKPQENA